MKKSKKEEAEIQSEEAKPLTKSEQQLLQKYESAIESSQKNYIAVGEALTEINRHRLHKGTHTSFDKYCDEKWGFSGSHAHRLIGAFEVVEKLRAGNISEENLPRNEYQARLLLEGREAKHRVRTWNKILKLAEKTASGITSSLIIEVLDNKGEKSSKVEKETKSSKAVPEPVVKALKLVEDARKDVDQDRKRDWKVFLNDLEELLKQL